MCDVRDKEHLPELCGIEILVNNAGTQNEDDIDINLKALIHITEKDGVQKDIKSILSIGSASAHTGAEFPEYSASKGGVIAYTKNTALRVAKQFGATGGTVIRARLAGTQNPEQFGDIDDDNISVEKEIITILAPANICKQIMEEVNAKYGLNSEARGTVCSVPVEKAFKI